MVPSGSVTSGWLRSRSLGAIHSLASWFEPGGGLTAEQVGSEFAQTLTQGLANRRSAKLRVLDFQPIKILEKTSNGDMRE